MCLFPISVIQTNIKSPLLLIFVQQFLFEYKGILQNLLRKFLVLTTSFSLFKYVVPIFELDTQCIDHLPDMSQGLVFSQTLW